MSLVPAGPPHLWPKLTPRRQSGPREKRHNSPQEPNYSKHHWRVSFINKSSPCVLTKLILLTKLSTISSSTFQYGCKYISSVLNMSQYILGKDDISRNSGKDDILQMISWRRLSYFWFWGQGKGYISFTERTETIWTGGVAVLQDSNEARSLIIPYPKKKVTVHSGSEMTC